MISSRDNPSNQLIYVVDTNLGSSIFYNDLDFDKEDQNIIKPLEKKNEQPRT